MMQLPINGRNVSVATGGVKFDGKRRPALVLVHGAGMDSSVWQQQTRYLANRCQTGGFGPVLAVDLPGHGSSDGPVPSTIGEMANWLGSFLEPFSPSPENGVPPSAPVLGAHSMGTFVVMELAARRPELVGSLVLFGTATAMGVHPDLLAAASADVPLAAALMSGWSHGKPSHLGPNPAPGMTMTAAARALIERSRPQVLAGDLAACASYQGALEAAAAVRCPVTIVAGSVDKMTPAKSAGALAEAFTQSTNCQLVTINSGHMMPSEDPATVRALLLEAVQSATGSTAIGNR